jgi:hypothetical protein
MARAKTYGRTAARAASQASSLDTPTLRQWREEPDEVNTLLLLSSPARPSIRLRQAACVCPNATAGMAHLDQVDVRDLHDQAACQHPTNSATPLYLPLCQANGVTPDHAGALPPVSRSPGRASTAPATRSSSSSRAAAPSGTVGPASAAALEPETLCGRYQGSAACRLRRLRPINLLPGAISLADLERYLLGASARVNASVSSAPGSIPNSSSSLFRISS